MQVTAVGTSGGLPTSQHGTSCVHLSLFGERVLFDCGEGSVQRLMRYDGSPSVDAVFISHFYADHTLGLPGLVQALEMNGRDRPLDIYAPEGRAHRAREMVEGAYRWPDYPVNVHGYSEDQPIMQTDDYAIRAVSTPYTKYSHGFVVQETESREFLAARAQELGLDPGPKYGKLEDGEAVETDDGRRIESGDVLSDPQPGRKIVYTSDTRPTSSVVEAASDASLLICSATFTEELAERARETGHSTARDAAQIASESGSQRLWLTHISPRHEGDEQTLEAQARDVFDGQVTAVRDGDTTEVTHE